MLGGEFYSMGAEKCHFCLEPVAWLVVFDRPGDEWLSFERVPVYPTHECPEIKALRSEWGAGTWSEPPLL